MAMTVAIDNATGATPTWAAVGASTAKFNRVDTLTGTTAIPTPTATGTNFSYIKTFAIDITATGSLSMTNVKIEKVTSEATTGTKLWHYTGHASYTQATAAQPQLATTIPPHRRSTERRLLPCLLLAQVRRMQRGHLVRQVAKGIW